jgi:pSer/pThr/pTyr-binding forkhead associated (FHA) protein
VPPFVLLALKIVFLALLYLFVYRVVRAVAVDVRRTGPRTVGGGPAAVTARVGAKTRPPRTLVVMDERGTKAQTHRLNGNMQIGRADSCDIKLGDTYVSANHARIYSRDDGWYVEDLGSTNGTYLNQRRLTAPAELRAGDKLRVGKTVMELRR